MALAQPIVQPCVSDVSTGITSMPIGERRTCGHGDSDTWPERYAVGSPRRHATHACAASCTVVENRNAGSQNTSAWKTGAGTVLFSEGAYPGFNARGAPWANARNSSRKSVKSLRAR